MASPEKFQVGDEFEGTHEELKVFILGVLAAGGEVVMIASDIALVTSLPVPVVSVVEVEDVEPVKPRRGRPPKVATTSGEVK